MSELELAVRVSKLEAQVAELKRGLAAPKTGTKSAILPASEQELLSEYGNPEIKYGIENEKYWPTQPDTHVGRKYSECPSEYLEALAKYLGARAWGKRKDIEMGKSADAKADEKKAFYMEKDAARALGWADRNRGRVIDAVDDFDGAEADDSPSIPF